MMNEETYSTLDLTPEAYREYRRLHGPHFNQKLCAFAVSRMKRADDKGNEQPIKPMEREEVDRILTDYDIRLEHQAGYDHVFAANMCKADYLGDSVPDMAHLAKYVKTLSTILMAMMASYSADGFAICAISGLRFLGMRCYDTTGD